MLAVRSSGVGFDCALAAQIGSPCEHQCHTQRDQRPPNVIYLPSSKTLRFLDVVPEKQRYPPPLIG